MSEKTITLPVSGATVKLRDPRTFKQKDRRKLMPTGRVNEDNATASGFDMFDNAIALLVEEWSLDLVIPSIRVEILGELEIADYDALFDEAKIAMEILFPKTNKTIETEADPKAPTANSKG